MTYQVLSTMKVKTKQGETIISQGQIIDLNPSKAESWIAQRKIRKISLEETLDTILYCTRDKIIELLKGKQYKPNAEIKQAEDEINRIYRAVLSGQGSLSEFQDAVNIWERRAIENVRK